MATFKAKLNRSVFSAVRSNAVFLPYAGKGLETKETAKPQTVYNVGTMANVIVEPMAIDKHWPQLFKLQA